MRVRYHKCSSLNQEKNKNKEHDEILADLTNRVVSHWLVNKSSSFMYTCSSSYHSCSAHDLCNPYPHLLSFQLCSHIPACIYNFYHILHCLAQSSKSDCMSEDNALCMYFMLLTKYVLYSRWKTVEKSLMLKDDLQMLPTFIEGKIEL